MKTVCNYVFRLMAKMTWMWFPLLSLSIGSCDDNNDGLQVIPSEIKVTNAVLQPSYTIPDNGTITVTGNGFVKGDAISMTDSLQQKYNALVQDVTTESITFGFDATFPQKGYYTVRLHRNDEDRVLGSTSIELVCDFGVENIVVDPKISVMYGKAMHVQGEGFNNADVIELILKSEGTAYTTTTDAVDASGISVKLPAEIPASGDYIVNLIRNGRKAQIGSANIAIVANTEMETKDGATIMGMVYCGIHPVENVVVSDGVNLTRTDANGHYWLNSTKSRGTVFISVPSGYTVPTFTGTNTPMHYGLLKKSATEVEQHNFELIAENQHTFVLLGLADAHLAKRSNDDIKQFQNGFLVDVNQTINELKDNGHPIYGMTLGDLSWDTYWYSSNYNFADAIKELYKVKCPVYNCIGNHDNDINLHDDYAAAHVYIENAGPNYYSINIGNTHIIVLDNIVYGAIAGASGASSCEYYIDDIQWEWFKKDLATVENRNNPLILCMHHALYRYPGLDANGNVLNFIGLDHNAGVNIVNQLADFSDVRVITGHTHVNYDAKNENGTLLEQNVAAICGTWWWTGASGFAGNNLCRDGVPGGYGIWTITGPKVTAYDYKSIGYPAEYQFRAFDLNQVYITTERYAPNTSFVPSDAEAVELMGGYDKPNTGNEILINVFNYGIGWSISVQEEDATGRLIDLAVTRTMAKDPAHILSYNMPYINKNNHYPTSGMVTTNSTKIFKAKANSATNPVIIKVTDPYGKVYTERMERPKAFHANMK